MLSICIPVFNYDCRQLITDLSKQVEAIDRPIEIIMVNDGSEKSFDNIYTNGLPAEVRYYSLAENIGRSKVRNHFIDLALYDYLLFLDCDVKLISENYIQLFIDQILTGAQVVCGSTIYPQEKPGKNKLLHWKYGKAKELALAKRKQIDPHASFMTNNFLIKKAIFSEIRFDESISQYGHEDTLFGYELYKRRVEITHIDNPVLHEDLDTNQVFLEKTKKAVENLVTIISRRPDPVLINSITLSKTYFRLRRAGLIFILQPFENIISRYCYKKLVNASASIVCLNLYKLCLFSKYYHSRK